MINFRIIARVFSLLLIVEGLFMLISAGVCYIYQERETSSFLYSAIITILTGIIVFTPLRNVEKVYGNREGYLIVTGIWLISSLFGTLPFLLSGSISNFGDAFFESISGFTTTGATIITDIESLPYGIIFWRSLTQWLGGVGIILISLSVLPVFKSLNIQLAAADFSGQPIDKIHPRINTIFLVLTLAEVILLSLGGMPVFDAICHSFSTLSTGGFSSRNDGISAFPSPFILIVITIFMFIAGINMTCIYFAIKGNFRKLIRNNELLFYSLISIGFIAIVSLILYFTSEFSFGKSILNGSFHVISIISTTGFYTQNYNLWRELIIIILFVLMFTGGTTGSTSGGIKIARLLLITKNVRQELKRLIHPNGFIPVRLDKKIIPQSTIYNMLVFITIYFLLICFSAFIISFMDYDLVTSFSTAASMVANIGPALGAHGPFTNYASMPMTGKMFLSGLMLLGRLELLTVMILFSRSFYRH